MSDHPAPKTDLFGVCTAIGRDFGIHADLLRVAFAVGLFFDPRIAIGVYSALGVAVALGRWLYPGAAPRSAIVVPLAAPAVARDSDRPMLEAA